MTAHGGRRVAAIDDEIVALGLACDRLGDRTVEDLVALRRPQRRAEVGGIVLTQAHIKSAGAGEPHAIAAFAEIVSERRDEAQPAAGLLDREVTRRAAGAVVAVVEREMSRDLGARYRQRQVLIEPRLAADLAHRHHLDEDEVHAAAVAPADELLELAVVDVT